MNDASDKTFEFFAICPPGLASICLMELKEKYLSLFEEKLQDPILSHGGISFKASLKKGCQLNKFLKTPTRILVRLTQFKCRDLPKLFQKTSKFPWNDLICSEEIVVKVSARRSRLIHTKRIENTFRDGFIKYRKASQVKKKDELKASPFGPATIYLHLEDDLLTISLDTSGERLNIRGERELISKAPLRENLAAAVAYIMNKNYPSIEKIVEPMAGSGVFTLESFHFYKTSSRKYSYQAFKPLFHIENETQSLEKKTLFKKSVVNELDEKVFHVLKKNLEHLKDFIVFKNGNYQDLFLSEDLLLLCNLPYGERIKVGNLKQFYTTFSNWCNNQKSIHAMGLILAENWSNFLQDELKSFKLFQKYSFSNGGIPVDLLILQREDLLQNKPSS